MRKPYFLPVVGLVMFALASCQNGTDDLGPDNSIVNESVKTTALTATVSTVFSNLDLEDRNYGTFGVLYSKSNDAAALFEKWKDGDNSVIGTIGYKKVPSIKYFNISSSDFC